MIRLTCDPGDNTGLALWGESETFQGWDSIHLKGKEKKLPTPERHLIMMDRFHEYLEKQTFEGIDSFIIEGVSLWGNSSKSQASALRGDSFRLAYLVGGYITKIREIFPSVEIKIVDVRSWKGNLPTPILENEVERFIGERAPNEHISCAVGIQMNEIGIL